MQVSRRSWLALLSLWPLACTNTPNLPSPIVVPADASGPVDRPVRTDGSGRTDRALDDSGSQCAWAAALDNGALAGCVPARAFVTCTGPAGSSSYSASEPTGCDSCSGTCQDTCAFNEFALSCHAAQSDAAVSSGPAQGCHLGTTLPLGFVVYCCPCQ